MGGVSAHVPLNGRPCPAGFGWATKRCLPTPLLLILLPPLPLPLCPQVLIAIQLAAVSPADVYSARLGGSYGAEAAPETPFVCGHDGVAVVRQASHCGMHGSPCVRAPPAGSLLAHTTPALWACHTC
jgi:hypothetical protein